MKKHKMEIPQGIKGETSKIFEEYVELVDFHSQREKVLSIVECSDILIATGWFSWKQYKVPLLFVVLLAYIRKPYKPIRNFVLDLLGYPKSYFLSKEKELL